MRPEALARAGCGGEVGEGKEEAVCPDASKDLAGDPVQLGPLFNF